MLPPVVRRQIKLVGTHQVAHFAAFMRFGHASPEAVEFLPELVRLVEEDRGAWQQIKQIALGSRHWRVEFPAGENRDPAGAHCGFDNLFRSRRSGTHYALARKPRVNRAQQLFVDRRFGEWQQ